ncbi:MAG: PAS domain-containing protein [Burkholderiales bacterium]|nr:PAS domain-containing protein [Burkholderiales bacterium]
MTATMALDYFSNLPIRSTEALDDPGEIADAVLRAAQSGGIGIFVWEITGGRMLWNDTMYTVYGLDRDSFPHTTDAWLSTLHPEDLPRVRNDVVAAINGDRPYDTVFRVRGSTGGWRYIKGTAWVERDATGRALRMAGINQDVTDHHRFHALVEAIEHGTSSALGQAFFQSLVDVLARTLGVRHVAVTELSPIDHPEVGRFVALSVDGKAGESAEFALAGSVCADVAHTGSCTFSREVQRLFPADPLLKHVNAQSYLGVRLQAPDGTVLGVLSVIDDKPSDDLELARRLLDLFAGRATAELERLRQEREVKRLNADLEVRVAARTSDLRRALQELEAFTYSVSHDLGAPLRAVQGFGAVLREDYADKLDEAGRNYLERTITAAERMGRLIDDLVSLSKISLRPLNVGKIDLVLLANGVVADLQTQRARPAMIFKCDKSIVVHADQGLMRIFLDCVLRTAWKSTELTRDPCIEFCDRQVGGRRELVIRDNGAGFDAETVERIFAPFQPLMPGGKRQTDFTGGTALAIAQRIVHRHHGDIRLESEPGQGASFVFWLPPAADLMAMLESERR